MKFVVFTALMLSSSIAFAQDITEESPTTGPNGLSIAITSGATLGGLGLLNGIGSTSLVLGTGLGERWRVDLSLSASATRRTFSLDADETQVTNLLLSPALSLHALFPVSENARTYAGGRVHTLIHYNEQNGEPAMMFSQDSIGADAVIGGELLVATRFALGIELGLGGSVLLPSEAPDGSSSTGWTLRTLGSLTARYYF